MTKAFDSTVLVHVCRSFLLTLPKLDSFPNKMLN
jgi:hypothetical protein